MVYFRVTEEQKVVALRRALQTAGYDCVYGRDDVRKTVEAGTVFARPSQGGTVVWVEDVGGTQLAGPVWTRDGETAGAWGLALSLLETRAEY